MTDIVEQAARVLTNELHYTANPYDLAQALADAGLLAQPTRTVPTREQIAKRVHPGYGRPRYDTETCSACERAGKIADAVLALMADQPTVAETKAQAWWEGVNDQWKHQPADVRLLETTNPYRNNQENPNG